VPCPVHHTVGLVAKVAVVATLALHGRSVGVGLAEAEVCLAPVGVAFNFPILAPRLGDPAAFNTVGGDELRIF
jgi:hypothetical protein